MHRTEIYCTGPPDPPIAPPTLNQLAASARAQHLISIIFRDLMELMAVKPQLLCHFKVILGACQVNLAFSIMCRTHLRAPQLISVLEVMLK